MRTSSRSVYYNELFCKQLLIRLDNCCYKLCQSMENEIARLLNLFCSDKVKLQELLSDYLEENGEDSEKENDVDSDDGKDHDVDTEVAQFDMRASDYDTAIEQLSLGDCVVSGDAEVELDKAAKFK